MFFKIAIGIATVSVLIAGVQTYRLESALNRGLENEIELRACGARLDNLIEDLESDNAIDLLPDGALADVPDHWLQPTGN